jgi:hypothetical protein
MEEYMALRTKYEKKYDTLYNEVKSDIVGVAAQHKYSNVYDQYYKLATERKPIYVNTMLKLTSADFDRWSNYVKISLKTMLIGLFNPVPRALTASKRERGVNSLNNTINNIFRAENSAANARPTLVIPPVTSNITINQPRKLRRTANNPSVTYGRNNRNIGKPNTNRSNLEEENIEGADALFSLSKSPVNNTTKVGTKRPRPWGGRRKTRKNKKN